MTADTTHSTNRNAPDDSMSSTAQKIAPDRVTAAGKAVSRRVHSLFAAILGPGRVAATDGSGRKSSERSLEETRGGKRVQQPSESTSPQSPDSEREYDPLAPICDYCGLPIDHAERRCSARDHGRCRP